TSVRYITGHQQKGQPVVHDWESLANPETTLVIYMGLANLAAIAENLLKAGLAVETPALAVQDGTTPQQKLVWGCVGDIAAKVRSAELASPTTVYIGKVVGIAKALHQQP